MGEPREHFDVMLAAAGAGRIHDDVLRAIERSLNPQEVMAEAARG